jgi:hypothetical protein
MHPCIIFRKALHEQYGYYSLNYKFSADVDFLQRVLVNGAKVIYSSEVLLLMDDFGFSGGNMAFYKKKLEHIKMRTINGKLNLSYMKFLAIILYSVLLNFFLAIKKSA